ncbi:N-6 DNA methylase [bacterium]|nr:N-6 DNA methylase [bacterium]
MQDSLFGALFELPTAPVETKQERQARLLEEMLTGSRREKETAAAQEQEGELLAFTGRKANTEFGRYQLAASKHCQYFTPVDFSNLLKELVEAKFEVPNGAVVFDPTCGSGRLLHPWKKSGFDVIGVEIDDMVARRARSLVGIESVRGGDILKYVDHCDEIASVVMTNPPFGLTWDIEGKADLFKRVKVGAKRNSIRGELVAIEAALRAVNTRFSECGLIVAILPEGFADDEEYRNALVCEESRAHVVLDVAFENLFKEYRIPAKARLQVLYVTGTTYDEHYRLGVPGELPRVRGRIDYAAPGWETELRALWDRIDTSVGRHSMSWPCRDARPLPDLSKIEFIPPSAEVSLSARGLIASPAGAAMLGFVDEVFTEYDPIRGIQGPAIAGCASRVSLLAHGVDRANSYLSAAGFSVAPMPRLERERLERARRRYEFLGTPVRRPQSHDRIAYYLDQPYVAAQDVRDDSGNLVWKAGRTYAFRPGWYRDNEVVKREEREDSKGRAFDEITRKESAVLKIRVDSETGPQFIEDKNVDEVRRLVEAFGLPDVPVVEDRYPEIVESYRRQLERRFPFLFDYQREDVARLATKNTGYLGYEMGGGKTVSAATWASARGYRRVLVVCQSGLVGNWLNELPKFGFKIIELRSHSAIARLRAEVAASKKSPNKASDGTTFYVTSYEFIANGDRAYDPWTCHREREDAEPHHVEGNLSHSCRECGRSYLTMFPACPKCGEKHGWSGICRSCGYRAFTYGTGPGRRGANSYPAIRYIRKLFGAVLVDEAQEMKSKTSLRGQAVRSIRSRGRLVMTGTIMKGYITDIYWTMGWLLGHDTPLFPYPYRAGSRRFLDEFATYEFVDREFSETLSRGRAKLIPEVSNLNRFRRLLAPMSVRRTKADMPELAALPKKTRNVEFLEMDREHADLYANIGAEARENISREFASASRNDREINMGVISRNLWMMHYAATAPTSPRVEGALPEGTEYSKLRRLGEILEKARAAGDKVLVFSGLRDMQDEIARYLKERGINFMSIFADTPSAKRICLIQQFEEDEDCTAIVTGLNVLNRGFTIIRANHVVITDIGYTPEPHRQAEDRVHRPGQKKDVHVHYLFSAGTIDEHIYQVTEAKQVAIDQAIDGRVDTATARYLKESAGDVRLAVAKLLVSEIVS